MEKTRVTETAQTREEGRGRELLLIENGIKDKEGVGRRGISK